MEQSLNLMTTSSQNQLQWNNVSDLLEELRKNQAHRRAEPTPKNFQQKKPGGGGKAYPYVKIAAFYRWLDKHYPGWSMEVIPTSMHQMANFVHIAVKLTVVEPQGVVRQITSYGADEAILKDGQLISHPYLKSAESDAIKRCVVKLGGFNDVYSELEAEQEPLSEAKAKWYVDNVLPLTLKHLPPQVVFKQMDAFANDLVSKQDLLDFISKYKETK